MNSNMGTENNNNPLIQTIQSSPPPPESTKNSPDYLAQLLKDKRQLEALSKLYPQPINFQHTERLLDSEINKVRQSLFNLNTGANNPLQLPEQNGPIVSLSEKMYVPQKEHPDFNFVGRILGPRGMTAKQLETATGCKIMVRGRGSMRDKKKEDQNRGKPNWEHLSDELHVLITVEDTEERSKIKLKRAVDEISKLLVPAPEGEDELKRRQLMELAIMKGTYRDTSQGSMTRVTLASPMPGMNHAGPRLVLSPMAGMRPQLTQGPAGQPLFLAPTAGSPGATQMRPGLSGLATHPMNPPPLLSPAEAASMGTAAMGNMIYSPEMLPFLSSQQHPSFLDYSGLDVNGALKRGAAPLTVRAHPYHRL